ncbi:hypothetical protein GQ54DRAFT_296720 [Martensiomyces pterosporus]|nr:hypothetical protein GQ54DRAFT_296720 [Martensiomyces pterosporus]
MSGRAAADTAEAAAAAKTGYPQPLRTISDEFRELQHVIDQFQDQLSIPDGTVGLHPFGPVNVDKAKTSFAHACRRLREALVGYRDTTLATWSNLIAGSAGQPADNGSPASLQGAGVLASTNRAIAAAQELGEMRQITDSLHEDIAKCRSVLLDAAADAISQALARSPTGQSLLLVDRVKAIAGKLGLAHYTDVQTHAGTEVTTVTLAGEILVIDVDISEDEERVKVKVSYVSETEHDERIDALMLRKLRSGDIRGFEALIGEMAQLDKLTKARSPANFIHNMFAIVATLAQIQSEELGALDGDIRQLLRYGSGIALPHTRHVGPSSLFYMPAAVKAGLTDEEWEALDANASADITMFDTCKWLYYTWEPSSSVHCFLSALFQQFCLPPEYSIEDSASHKVLVISHPTIHGLELRFLQFIGSKGEAKDPNAMQVDGAEKDVGSDINDEFWVPYALVANLEPSMPACALTVRKAMEATLPDSRTTAAPGQSAETIAGGVQDSPRLLEDAPTLETMLYAEHLKRTKGADDSAARVIPPAMHQVDGHGVAVEMDSPQIRAWTICRVPLSHPRNILTVVPILRRQAIFNELLSSCFVLPSPPWASTETPAGTAVSARTFARDPFRIDIVIRRHSPASSDGDKRARVDGEQPVVGSSDASQSEEQLAQGVVLRVAETTGDIMAWTHQAIGASPSPDLFASMDGVPAEALTDRTANRPLSKVANLSRSIPIIAYWLTST